MIPTPNFILTKYDFHNLKSDLDMDVESLSILNLSRMYDHNRMISL